MTVIHTILREDFGPLDSQFIKTGLLSQGGIRDVHCGPARNQISIEYDSSKLSAGDLRDLMCRYGVFPDSSYRHQRRASSLAQPDAE